MKILADESVDLEIVERLRNEEHDVKYLAEVFRGSDDNEVTQLTREEQRVFLTADKDSADVFTTYLQVSLGMVLLRMQGLRAVDKADRVVSVVQDLADRLTGQPPHYAVIGAEEARSRPMVDQ